MFKKQIAVAGVAVLLVIIIATVLVFNLMSKPEVAKTSAESSAEAVSDAVEKSSAPIIAVPTSVNPINQVLPKENPIEKTNPFNKTYVNPFE